MRCPHCSETIPDDSTFCPECGKDVTKPPGGRRPSWLLITLVVGGLLMVIFVLLLALGTIDESGTGTTAASGDTPQDSALTMPPDAADAGTAAAFQVGDCLTDTLAVVACTEPHYSEVYSIAEYDQSEDFPGEDVLAGYGDEVCLGPFEQYVGTPYEQSSLFYFAYYPTIELWDLGERQILCVLTLDEQVSESFQGSAR